MSYGSALARLVIAVGFVSSCTVTDRYVQIDEDAGAGGAAGASGASGAAGKDDDGSTGTMSGGAAGVGSGGGGASGTGGTGGASGGGAGAGTGGSGGAAGSTGGASGRGGAEDSGATPDTSVIRDSGDAEACVSTVTCSTPNGNYCGVIGDGCGRSLDCGPCAGGFTCGGAGTPNVCGAQPDSGGCTTTCRPMGGIYCGTIGTGCGGTIDCGACPAGQVCGLKTPNVCGMPCLLCPMVPTCSDASLTTITGTVVTGAANNADPVYKASVYIPNIALGTKLPPLPSGASCNQCTPLTADTAMASAVTGADGTFVLQGNIPAGNGIPLVVQLGKWRYETAIDVLPCTNNVLPAGTARLPRVQSEGNIPLTAVSTGNVDALECILRKVGVADTEFGNPGGAGRIHFYRNNGANYDTSTPNQTALVTTQTTWDLYDQVLFPCEGMQTNETAGALLNFVNYTSKGGRVFTTHFSYTWLYQNGGFGTAGQWQVNQAQPPSPLIANIDVTQPKGQDFATWLGHVGALSNANPPQVSINDPRRNLNAVSAGQGGERWIYADTPALVQHMTIDTPVIVPPDPDKVCGRVIYSDFHVANAINSALTFPAECPTIDLTPQEKILEFMLFDLSSCVGGGQPPPPPPPLPPPPPPPPVDP